MSSKSYIRAHKNIGPKPDRSPPDNSKRTAQLQHPPTPRPVMQDVGTQTSPHLYPSSSTDPFMPGPGHTPGWFTIGDDWTKGKDKWQNAILYPDLLIPEVCTWAGVVPRPSPLRLPSIEGVEEESPAKWMGWEEKSKNEDKVDENEMEAVSPASSGAVGSADPPVSPLFPASQTDTGKKTSPAYQNFDRFNFYGPKNALPESRYPPGDRYSSNDEAPTSPALKPLQKTISSDKRAKRDRRDTRYPSPLPVIKDGTGCKGDRLRGVPHEKPARDHGIAVFDDYLKSESPLVSPDRDLGAIVSLDIPWNTLHPGRPPFVNDEPVICLLHHGNGFAPVPRPGQGKRTKPTDAVQKIGAKQHGQEARQERNAQGESKAQRKARKKADRKEAKKAAKKSVWGIKGTNDSADQEPGPSNQAASASISSPATTDTIHILDILPGSDLAGAAVRIPSGRRNAVSRASRHSPESLRTPQETESDDMGNLQTTDQPSTDRDILFTTPVYDGSTAQVSDPGQNTPQISPLSLSLPLSAHHESASQLGVPIDNDKPIICMRVHSISRRPMCQSRSPPVPTIVGNVPELKASALVPGGSDRGKRDSERRARTIANRTKRQTELGEKRAEAVIREQDEAAVVAGAFKRLQRQTETALLVDDEMPSVKEARAASMRRVRHQQVHLVIRHHTQPPKGTRRLQKRGRHSKR